MASIPLPALGIKPPEQPDVLGQYAKALSVKDMIQQHQMGQVQLDQAQLGQREQQTIMQSLAQHKGDPDAALADLQGKVRPQTLLGMQEGFLKLAQTKATLHKDELDNNIKVNDATLGLIDQAKSLSPEAYLAAWPQIAATALKIHPEYKDHIDPNTPIPQQALDQIAIGAMTDNQFNARAKAKQEAAESTARIAKDQADTKLTEQKIAGGAGVPVDQQQLNAWLNTPQANGKTRRDNGLTAADYEQAKLTHTSTQSDSLGITTSTTSAPGLNRGAAPVNPALAPSAAPTARPSGQAPAAGATMTPAQAINAGVHGEDFLKTLSPSIRNTVKRIGDYQDDESMLSRLMMRHPEVSSYISQYAPDFDRTNYDAKRKLMIDYTSGTHSKEINAVNTAMGHVAELGDAIDALKNGDIKIINSIANKLQIQTGGTAAATVALIARRVAPEIATVYTPTGGGQTERIADEKDFDFSLGQDILKKNVTKTVDLLRSKIGALENQYKNTVGRDDFEKRFITPAAKTALQKYSTQAPAGATHAVKDASGKIIGYTTDGKTMTPAQ
jgi:hypothetical protein